MMDWPFWGRVRTRYCRNGTLRDLVVRPAPLRTDRRRTGGGSDEAGGGGFAPDRAWEICSKARESSLILSKERFEGLDRDQPPTADLARAERSGGHELIKR